MQALQWLLPWEPSFAVLLATAVTAGLFITGCIKYRMQVPQKISFWMGFLALYGVCHTQFEYYAEHAFFMHQLQSLALHQLGPFLIALSHPRQALLAACPVSVKRLRSIAVSPAQRSIGALCHPLAVTLMFVGLSGFWLLPSVHFIAMLDWRIHALMNASMAISGLLFWGSVLERQTARSAACRIAMLLAVVPPQILVGVLIFFSARELYPIYALCGRAFTGMSSVTDQQLGGLILWSHAAMMSVAGVLIVIRREWRQAQTP